jgi:hypothetical protein
LDLLAADAIQANKGFSRAPSPSGEAAPARNLSIEGLVNHSDIERQPVFEVPTGPNGLETRSWQLDHDIVLKDFETAIFRNFVDHASLWVC